MSNPVLRLSLIILICSLFLPCSAYSEIKVDGKTDEPEWAGAGSYNDFVVVYPLTLAKPRLTTEAKVLSVQEGLAVAFICDQPADETRTRTITRRDASRFDSDSVSVMVDFDATGKIAYEFSVSIAGSYRDGAITNQSDFNYDWDGVWQHAVNEDNDRWTVEILIPWSIVAMREGENNTRKLGLLLQRTLQSTKETFGFPAASSERPQFVSNFHQVDVAEYTEKEFDLWPYVTVLGDLKNNNTEGKAGLDLFWKPSGKFQVAATFNPDFGQVESDDLVIDFSAIEVRFSDKRPFFTENQALLELRMPNQGYLIYTRRIGGPGDKDGSPSDIAGALKVIGSAGKVNYGVLAARETGQEGRTFSGARMVLPGQNWSVGTFTTYVERPFLDRTALVNSLDYEIKSKNLLRLQGQFLVSQIDKPSGDTSDFGAWYRFYYTPSEAWHLQMDMSHWGKDLDISDMGYIMRTNLEELFLYGKWRQTGFSADSRAASVDWTLWSIYRRNAEGLKLQSKLVFQKQDKLRSGSGIDYTLMLNTAGYDDIISRGHGPVHYDNLFSGSASYSTQRKGSWRKSAGLNVMQEGTGGWGGSANANATWYPSEKFNIDLNAKLYRSSDWVIWLHDDLLAGYSIHQVTAGISPSWFPAERHEIRLKTQWIVMKAENGQDYNIGPRGRLIPGSNTVNDFSILNFGLQLRYRYEIAPLSDFYIVYSRGGLDRVENADEGTMGLLGSSTELRDSDQLLLKVRYRF